MQTSNPDLEPIPFDEPGSWRFSPSTIWSKVIAAGADADLCAACGSHDEVVPDQRCGEIPFCTNCTEHTRSATEWDDIGALD